MSEAWSEAWSKQVSVPEIRAAVEGGPDSPAMGTPIRETQDHQTATAGA